MANPDDHPDIDTLDIGDKNEESSESEIERLDLCSPGLDSPTERGVAKTKKEEDFILKIIRQTKTLGSNTLELCDKGMIQIPRELLDLNNLEVIHIHLIAACINMLAPLSECFCSVSTQILKLYRILLFLFFLMGFTAVLLTLANMHTLLH